MNDLNFALCRTSKSGKVRKRHKMFGKRGLNCLIVVAKLLLLLLLFISGPGCSSREVRSVGVVARECFPRRRPKTHLLPERFRRRLSSRSGKLVRIYKCVCVRPRDAGVLWQQRRATGMCLKTPHWEGSRGERGAREGEGEPPERDAAFRRFFASAAGRASSASLRRRGANLRPANPPQHPQKNPPKPPYTTENTTLNSPKPPETPIRSILNHFQAYTNIQGTRKNDHNP